MAELRKEWIGVGTAVSLVRIEARELANFAAGVQSRRRAYYDDTVPEGVASFPTFCSRLSWHAVKDLWRSLIDRGCPPEIMERQVHYRSDIRNHRSFRRGEQVQIQARVQGMASHRAGTLMATEVSMLALDGSPICVEIVEGLLRGVGCDTSSETCATPRGPTSQETAAEEGQEHVVRFEIPMLLPYQYDGCADIHFPIHSSPAHAHKAGLPGIIVQGSATLSVCVDMICDWIEPGGDRVILPVIGAKYGAYLLPGEKVQLTARARTADNSATSVNFTLNTDDGRQILKEGHLELAR